MRLGSPDNRRWPARLRLPFVWATGAYLSAGHPTSGLIPGTSFVVAALAHKWPDGSDALLSDDGVVLKSDDLGYFGSDAVTLSPETGPHK